jgi:hypothetical protein
MVALKEEQTSASIDRTSILFPRPPNFVQATRERNQGISVSAG